MFRTRPILLSAFLSLCLMLGLQQPVNAGMVGTQSLLNDSAMLMDLKLIRQGIEKQLVDLGIDQQQAKVRVEMMSDAQVIEISEKISELPAGAGAGGVILLLFIVFIITDVLGATDIFPFIRPMN